MRIKDIFSLENSKLPTANEWAAFLKAQPRFSCDARYEYVDHVFPILSECFIKKFVDYLSSYGKVMEVMAGEGWVSHWLNKYGCDNIISVTDNKSWKGNGGSFNYLPIVEKKDATEAVKEIEADVVIMSWPYMDDTALRVWEALRPGTRLVYIGEGFGGCTANDEFFTTTSASHNKEESIELCKDTWLTFDMIHDYPEVYIKGD